MDYDFHEIIDENNCVINEPEEIIIGNNVWIGCRCLILKGVEIKDGSVVGANSTVTRQLEKENSVYAGNPVKCIKENIKWIG